jgi:hypothetical protein
VKLQGDVGGEAGVGVVETDAEDLDDMLEVLRKVLRCMKHLAAA